MTNKKTTKRALLTSIMAMLLCLSMFVGTTFAWFTDSVTSGVNKIVAGNLDIELEYYSNGGWKTVNNATELFSGELWEPGHTEVVYLKLSNLGSLALKYQLGINVTNETKGTNKDNETFKLSEYIRFGVDDGQKPTYETREKAVAAVTDKSKALSTGYKTSGTMLAGDKAEELYMALVVYMPTTVGDKANYKTGTPAPTIDLGITLVATQNTEEADSFNNEYDKDATYDQVNYYVNNASELKDAIANANDGSIVVLTDDVDYGTTDQLKIEKDIILDLNGKTLTTAYTYGGISAKGGCIIKNGTINHTGTTAAIKAFQVEAIEDVTINVTETAGKTKGGIVVQEGAGCYVGSIKNVTINGATNGIECYRSTNKAAIGSMENVKINATQNGIYLNGAGSIGLMSNCEINAGDIGINAYLANLWHISLNIENSTITAGRHGIDIWDEAKVNTGSTVTFKYDNETNFVGGTYDIKVTLQEEIACTINGETKVTPCEFYVKNDAASDTLVTSVEGAKDLFAKLSGDETANVTLFSCNEPDAVLEIPESYTGTLTLNNVTVKSVNAEGDANIVILGNVEVNAAGDGVATASDETTTGVSAITASGELSISGTGKLTAIGCGAHGYGIGGDSTSKITISDISIEYVAGGCIDEVGEDTKYYKDAPEGGAAIGSGCDGAVITLNNVTISEAIGGSKAAGIGAISHTGVTVEINDSTISCVKGGVSAAGIGGSRVSNFATNEALVEDEIVKIEIKDSTITAQGGAYGAGIGSGYDTYCQGEQPLCTIEISGSSVINATGGKYAAGIGTGYHNAALAGKIEESVVVTAASGEKYYKDEYTLAMDVGFGVVDPSREGVQTDSKIIYNNKEITIPAVLTLVSDGLYKDADGNYYVYNATGLQALKNWIDSNSNKSDVWGKTYNIMADIDASEVVWTTKFMVPDSATFDGFTFNGNGHTISNLTINGQGLFTGTSRGSESDVPATFQDITFDNATVTGGTHHNGVIWGEVYGDITLKNVNVINSKVSGGCNVGGLVGRNSESHATIKFIDCSVKNTTIEATQVADYAGASSFLGMALHIGTTTSANVIFEGNNVSEGNTLNTAAGMQGGGIYTIATWDEATWETPTVVNNYKNYNSNGDSNN